MTQASAWAQPPSYVQPGPALSSDQPSVERLPPVAGLSGAVPQPVAPVLPPSDGLAPPGEILDGPQRVPKEEYFRSGEIERLPSGKPELRLHGEAFARAAAMGAKQFHVSLTHDQLVSCAIVIFEA